jgi:hypothetical protein
LLEAVVFPLRLPVLRQRGDLFWDEQAAIGCETFQDDILEGELVYVKS